MYYYYCSSRSVDAGVLLVAEDVGVLVADSVRRDDREEEGEGPGEQNRHVAGSTRAGGLRVRAPVVRWSRTSCGDCCAGSQAVSRLCCGATYVSVRLVPGCLRGDVTSSYMQRIHPCQGPKRRREPILTAEVVLAVPCTPRAGWPSGVIWKPWSYVSAGRESIVRLVEAHLIISFLEHVTGHL